MKKYYFYSQIMTDETECEEQLAAKINLWEHLNMLTVRRSFLTRMD